MYCSPNLLYSLLLLWPLLIPNASQGTLLMRYVASKIRIGYQALCLFCGEEVVEVQLVFTLEKRSLHTLYHGIPRNLSEVMGPGIFCGIYFPPSSLHMSYKGN